MLLGCISSKENCEKIQEVLKPQKDTYVRHYNVEEIKSLKEFVVRGRNNMNFEMLAIYLDDIEKSDVVEAVKMFKTIYDARLIIIAENTEENKAILAELGEKCRVYNTIVLGDNTDFEQEIGVCLSEDGKTLKNAITNKKNAKIEALRKATTMRLKIPKGFCLNVGVAGVNTRVGTTTQAMLMYAYLKTLGFTPCLIDGGGYTIDTMALAYDNEGNEKQGLYKFNGVVMAAEKPDLNEINAYVYDFGELNPTNAGVWGNCDLTYLCSGSKPWELTDVAGALASFEEAQNAHLLLSFAGESDKKTVKELVGDQCKYTYVPYLPDVFVLENWQFYAQLMLNEVREKVNG